MSLNLFLGAIKAELKSANAKFFSEEAGLILPALDYSARLGRNRLEAIVKFSQLFAQCPGSCLATCHHVIRDEIKVEFPAPKANERGCCGPVGLPGDTGYPGPQGGRGK